MYKAPIYVINITVLLLFLLSEFTEKEDSILKEASKKAGNLSKKRGCQNWHPLL